MVEARKILGGAGPAVATIPASLIWASISLAELAKDVAYGKVSHVMDRLLKLVPFLNYSLTLLGLI